jgi:hypothetical protein
MSGIRSGAARKLEQAFAAAFAQYFVGDPTYAMPPPGAGPIFVSGQSVQQLTFPNVTFLCLEAKEVSPGIGNYQGVELHIMVNTALIERPDDYPSLLALHDDRVDKLFILLGNTPLLQSLMNQPASGPDTRLVREMLFYGTGLITKEMRIPEQNRLSDLISVETNFRPSDS